MSQSLNTAFERPSTMSSSRAGPDFSRFGVRSMITVTYVSSWRVCRQACSSTPIVVTPSNRVRVIDQAPLALGEDRRVRGRSRHPEVTGDAGDREAVEDEAVQTPRQSTAGGLRPLRCCLRRVLPPDLPTPGALVTTHADQQRRGPVPELFVHEPARHRVPGRALAPYFRRHRSGSTTRHSITTRFG